LNENHWALLPFLSSLVLYIFVVFGFLSRRCERQADIFGCRAVSCSHADCPGHTPEATLQPEGRGLCSTGIRTFIQALEKVAHLNGISRSRPGWLQSWQHSTIARRVEFLQRMLVDPEVEPRFQRRVALVKWALIGGLAVVLAALFAIPDRPTYIIVDRSDPDREYLYIVRGNGVTARVTDYSCCATTVWHRRDDLSIDPQEVTSLPITLPWATDFHQRPAPPYSPEYSWTEVLPDQSSIIKPVPLEPSEKAVQFFSRLRQQIITDESRITEPPKWLRADTRMRGLGLCKPVQTAEQGR
jgi:hypothetical protein